MTAPTFLWPAALWGLLLVPALAAVCAWTLRRRIRYSIAFPAVETVATAVMLAIDVSGSIDPLDAAEWARREQMTVHTVGIGSPPGSTTGFMMGGPLDEAALQAIAQRTGGTHHHATSAGQLRDIYRTIGRSVGWTVRPVEVTGALAAIVALFLAAAVTSIRAQPLLT